MPLFVNLFVVLVVVHGGDGVENLLVVVVHAEGVAALGQDDQQPWRKKNKQYASCKWRCHNVTLEVVYLIDNNALIYQ